MPNGSQSRRAAKTVKKGRRATGEWWTTYFDQRYLHEFEPLFDLERDRQEVARLIDLMGLPSGARLLDVPCGQGRHAHLFAEAGFNVDGLDYSGDLLAIAKRRGTSTTLRYSRGDMRRLPARWTGRFDAVVNLFTSFGFFANPADDRRTLAEFARVLRPGGVLAWHGADRDGVMARFLGRDWWVTGDGTLFGQERAFDSLSGVLTVSTTWRGSAGQGTREHRIRLFTPTRLAELCAEVGLVVEQAFDGFTSRPVGRRSSQMLLVARKDLTRPTRQAFGDA